MNQDESAQVVLAQTRAQAHPRCVVCGSTDGERPRLQFAVVSDHCVEAHFVPGAADEGYPGMLHGGIIATLLDAAMTNCLFADGRPAVTGELTVRYREPVLSERECQVRGWLERAAAHLYCMRAEIRQAGGVRASATGKFMLR